MKYEIEDWRNLYMEAIRFFRHHPDERVAFLGNGMNVFHSADYICWFMLDNFVARSILRLRELLGVRDENTLAKFRYIRAFRVVGFYQGGLSAQCFIDPDYEDQALIFKQNIERLTRQNLPGDDNRIEILKEATQVILNDLKGNSFTSVGVMSRVENGSGKGGMAVYAPQRLSRFLHGHDLPGVAVNFQTLVPWGSTYVTFAVGEQGLYFQEKPFRT